ncbi:MAG: trypsin-like peptidase domain-containing protein [Bdellovibrionales bacterium]|nr:trypsin-like peptidase domain-containing protein [Bdellovibrionales bacterium]
MKFVHNCKAYSSSTEKKTFPYKSARFYAFAVLSIVFFFDCSYASLHKKWNRISHRYEPAIVAIEIDVLLPLFSEKPGLARGTGLVIDASKGLIVVNQQVSRFGKISQAQAKFFNEQIVPIKLVYQDPWHDFAVFQYEVELVSFSIPKITFQDSRTIAENQNILALSHDWNQGISLVEGKVKNPFTVHAENKIGRYSESIDTGGSLSGALLGSPIFTQKGKVIAFHCHDSNKESIAISSLYVRDVLTYLPHKTPPRGDMGISLDIENVFRAEEFYALSPLYVPKDSIGKPTHPFVIKMTRCISSQPTCQKLLPGDILLAVRSLMGPWKNIGQQVYDFDRWMDQHVGQNIEIKISRMGKEMVYSIPIVDAYKNIPKKFMTFAGATFHELTPTLQMIYDIKKSEGIYISDTLQGSSFGNSTMYGKLLEKFSGLSIDSFDDLKSIFIQQKNHSKTYIETIDYYYTSTVPSIQYIDLEIERFPLTLYVWDSLQGNYILKDKV